MSTRAIDTIPWRDRHPKIDPNSRCCWVCGRRGGNGFSTALRIAGYRMEHGEMAYAHSNCMRLAQAEASAREKEQETKL